MTEEGKDDDEWLDRDSLVVALVLGLAVLAGLTVVGYLACAGHI